MVNAKLILVISTLDREHNFLGLFDQSKKTWIKELEFKVNGAEEFFPIFKDLIYKKTLLNIDAVIIEQARGSFSGLRLETAIANSLKIKNKNLALFSIRAEDIKDLRMKVVENKGLIKAQDFIYPEYPGLASIHK